ncbi:MAG: cyclic-di-AMP receptor [Christensenellales bacterium]|jgi:uncharacterized protein YaaQ
MKLLIAIVQDEDSQKLMNALTKEKYSVTKLATTGGFLRVGNTTMIMGVEDDKVEDAIHIIESVCKSRSQMVPGPSPITGTMGTFIPYPIEVTVGGATVFVLDVEQFRKV